MDIWLVIVGEPLPGDADNARLYRKGMLAERLLESGHNVVLWSSTINHMLKTKRANQTVVHDIKERYKMVLLDAPMYKKNISLMRIWHNVLTAREFTKIASKMPLPDVIVSSYPPIELCAAVTKFGRKKNVPTILDARDMWPDIFVTPFPKSLTWLGNLLKTPFERLARETVNQATAISGISDQFVDWLIAKADIKYQPDIHKSFYLAYGDEKPNKEDQLLGNTYWDDLGVSNKSEKFVAGMMGNMVYDAEIDGMIRAAKALPDDVKEKFQLVICGTGMAIDDLRALAQGEPHIFLPGWMSRERIWSLLRRSTVGMLPYLSDHAGLNMSFPNKVGEYLCAGLPIVSCLHGSLSELLLARDCGVVYPNKGDQQLTQLLIRLEQQPDRIDVMSQNAREVYLDLFQADQVYSEYCEFIEQVARLNKKLEI
jgi:glycosyltransferase involved in cell wall biosynthesis